MIIAYQKSEQAGDDARFDENQQGDKKDAPRECSHRTPLVSLDRYSKTSNVNHGCEDVRNDLACGVHKQERLTVNEHEPASHSLSPITAKRMGIISVMDTVSYDDRTAWWIDGRETGGIKHKEVRRHLGHPHNNERRSCLDLFPLKTW
jgi:hypothetical protein